MAKIFNRLNSCHSCNNEYVQINFELDGSSINQLSKHKDNPWIRFWSTSLKIVIQSWNVLVVVQDVLRSPPDRALFCNYLHCGLYDGTRLVTLGPHRDIVVDEIGADALPHRVDALDRSDDPLVLDCIAYYQGASDAWANGRFGR